MILNLINAVRFRPSQLVCLHQMLDIFIDTINTSSFERAIIDHSPFRIAPHMNNRKILDKIMGGREVNSNTTDFEADMFIVLKAGGVPNEIGYTVADRIFTYEQPFNELPNTRMAGHYAHEYCHLLGFRDPQTRVDVPYNVPYEVGRIVTAIAENRQPIFLVTDMSSENLAKTRSLPAAFIATNNLRTAKKLRQQKSPDESQLRKQEKASRTAYLIDQQFPASVHQERTLKKALPSKKSQSKTQCKARTQDGKRCSRQAVEQGYCRQHFTIYNN